MGRTALHVLLADRLFRDPEPGLEILEQLLEGGADPNLRQDFQRHAPIHVLTSRLYEGGPAVAALELLIAHGADVNAEAEFFYTYDQLTPLHLACLSGHRAAAIALLDAGASLDAVSNLSQALGFHGQRQPIHLAIAAGTAPHVPSTVDLVSDLLRRGADPHAEDGGGNTPLHFARTGPMVRLLLEHGARATVRNAQGIVPQGGDLPSVELLLAAGGDLNTTDYLGRTRLHHATDPAVIGHLRARGLNPEARDQDGRTPFFYVQTLDHAVALLAVGPNDEPGADPNARDNAGVTRIFSPLSPDLLDQLLHRGLDPDARDGVGMTRLHYAVANGEPEHVAILLEHGADQTIRDLSGRTPLDWAHRYDRGEIVEMLEMTPEGEC